MLTLHTVTVVFKRLTLVDKEPLVELLSTQLKRLLDILRAADGTPLFLLVEVLMKE